MNPPDPGARATARPRPLRMRLLLLAASGLVPLVVLLAWGMNYLVHERNAQEERAVLELSRALATGIDAELRSVIALLELMGTSDALEKADLNEFHASARRTARQLGWRQIVLADGEGRILARTNSPFGSPSLEAVEPASLAQVLKTAVPAVSPVVEAPGTGTDTFAVRVPVVRSGKIVYVVTAVLSTDLVSSVLTRQAIPEGSVAAVFDQRHLRVARSRQVPTRLPSASLRALLARGDAQGAGRTVTSEGVESYTGFTRLKDSGWVVAVGKSVSLASEGLYGLLRAAALGVAASLALAFALAWLLSRRVLGPIESLKGGAAALGRGEPVQLPPLDTVELDEVGRALAAAAHDRDRAAAQVADALRAAEEANRSKDQFMAMLGHELRNPLAPIANAVQLMALKGDASTAPERRIIERQLVHVTRLVDDLLDVSRITSGRLALRHEQVRMAPLLGQVVETIRQSLFQRTLALELGPGMEEAWVHGDEVRLVQVFNNLLVNAVKFTAPGEAIVVRAAVDGGDVQVQVRDGGVGIPADELERIFELFYQAAQSSDRARGGLGLGLPIVRSLVQMHGGTVQAASDGPGRGSCLTVRLPLCAAPAANVDTQPPAGARGGGNVLVVDDNQDAADTCATLLELSGYAVQVAYTPEDALRALQQFTPRVAILDIGLPGMSGYELAGRMKAAPHGYQGWLVALTGYGQAADLARSKEAGFDAHLTKPVSPAALLELVEQFSS